jgi:DNA mismatch repair protein MutL
LKDGYATLTDAGRYAPAILFIDMPPEDVDVNVHPAKREVRFKYDYAVSRAVTAAVNNALKRSRECPAGQLREPALPITGQVPLSSLLETMQVNYTPKEVEQGEFELHPTIRSTETVKPQPEPEVKQSVPAETPRNVLQTVPELPEPELPDEPEISDVQETEETPDMDFSERFNFKAAPYTGGWPTEILGVLDNTYILAAGPQGLIMIDQHAAHERIMFEKILDQARKGAAAQALLLPQMVELPRSLMGLVLKYRPVFEKLGFDVEPMGNTSLMVNALPLNLKVSRPLTEVFPDMLQELLENSENKIPVDGAYIARAACRSAIKAHEKLPPEGAAELLRQLGECRQGTLCPHGRPTLININYNEIEKRFGRR